MGNLNINVMVIGESGAGKTVYLSGLFQRLSIDRIENVITIKTNSVDTHLLDATYAQVVNPNSGFPDSTGWVARTWQFDCHLTSTKGDFVPFTVSYIDYDGRMLRPLQHGITAEQLAVDEKLQELERLTEQTDAFLIIIDGYRLLRMLQGDPAYAGWLDTYLPSQLRKLRAGPRKNAPAAPVHFVVTKWDLFDQCLIDDVPVTLERVRKVLLDQPSLVGYLRRREAHGMAAVRVIPVSVTGPFAKLNEEQRIVKVPDQPVRPLNLEIPFLALLPDYLSGVLHQLQVSAPDAIDPATGRLQRNASIIRRVRGFVEAAHGPLAGLFARRIAARYGPVGRTASGAVVQEVLEGLLDTVDSYLAAKESATSSDLAQIEQAHHRRQAAVDNEREALKLALDSFEVAVREFERAHPGSVLSGDSDHV